MTKEVALITGSSSGIGAATAELFAQHDYHVVVAGRDEQRTQEVCERIRANGNNADYFVGDLTHAGAAGRLIEFSTSLGNLAVLINCLGGNKPGMSLQEHLALNYIAPRSIIETGISWMSRGGSVIAVTSICSESKQAHEGGPYTDAKAALSSFLTGLVGDYAYEGIRINTIAPGLTDTRDTAHLAQNERSGLAKKMPLTGRFLTPKEVADAIYCLNTLNVTGQTLVIDGGMTAVHD